MMSAERVFLGLGSNLGDRERALLWALDALSARGFRARATSSLYETEPVGGPSQGSYLNAVAEGETALLPADLLAAALDVERTLGRVRTVRNAPRTVDIDLLLFGPRLLVTPGLTIPHPRLHERRFVLVPLVEIAPEVRHPRLGLTSTELLDLCPDQSSVVKLGALAR